MASYHTNDFIMTGRGEPTRLQGGVVNADLFPLLGAAQGMILVLIGEAIGLAGAYALTRVIRGLLFGVTPTDLTTFLAVAVNLAAVALLATFYPSAARSQSRSTGSPSI